MRHYADQSKHSLFLSLVLRYRRRRRFVWPWPFFQRIKIDFSDQSGLSWLAAWSLTFERSYSCTIHRVPHRVNFAIYWSRYNTDKTNWGHLSSKNGLFSFVCTSPNIHMHDLITPYGPKYDTEFMGSWVTFWFALLAALRIYSIIINCAIPTDLIGN